MSQPSRNDPCHCGSGRKYKNCHLRADEAMDRAARGAPVAQDAREAHSSAGGDRALLLLAGLGVIAAIALGAMSGPRAGLLLAAAWAIGVMIWMSLRDLPPPHENPGDPAALNFGQPVAPRAENNGNAQDQTGRSGRGSDRRHRSRGR